VDTHHFSLNRYHSISSNRYHSPAFIRAVTVLIPDFNHYNGDPVFEAFQQQITLTLRVLLSAWRSKIRQKDIRFLAFSLPKILPRQFRHDTQALKTFILECVLLQRRSIVEFTANALVVFQTIFEALQDGVVTSTTLDGRRKLRLESPNGVTREIIVMDWDAVDITHSAGEEDDAEIFQLRDQDADDSSDEGDEQDE
jgi:hypothetical protein